jgi:hypothetical protein
VLEGNEVGCEDITTEDKPVCACEECVRTLSFVYTGKSCPSNQQLTGKCTDSGPNPFIAGYRITNALDPTEVLATGQVQQNEDITIDAVSASGCIPDTLAVSISVPTGEVTQTFTIDSSCSGGRGLILTEDYGAFESYGYSCGATDVHNCKQTISYGLKVCNTGSDDQTIYDWFLKSKDTISNAEVFTDLLEGVNPEDIMLSPSECYYDTKSYDVNRCQEENYCVDITSNATNPVTGIPKNCPSSDQIKFGWPPLVPPDDTPQPSPAPSPAPSPGPTSTCVIDVELDGCPQYNLSLANNCEGRPQVITFRYNGGDCSQSDNLQTRQKFFCVDENGGPPPRSALGTESFIEAVPTNGGDLYFSGVVKVGEAFTLNENMNFDKLSADMTISTFTRDGSTLLQRNDVHLSCSQPLYLFDKFGSNQVIEWIETSGRVVTNRQSDVPTGNIKVQLDVAPDVKPVRLLEMQVITSAQDAPIDYTSQVAGQLLTPGVPIELPGFDIDIDLSTRSRYTFFTTIIGETEDGTNMCNGNSFLECTIGFNLNPTFPTFVPTPRPTVTPFPTGAIATTPCQIASSIGCTVTSPALSDVTCDNLGGGSATCPANEKILRAYFEYDGSQGDSVFVLGSCDKSEYIKATVNSGGIVEFNNRADDVCDVLTVEMFQSEDSGSISSADIDVPCPGPWTIGTEILPGLKLAYYVSSSDGGNSFNVNVLQATVQIDYIGSNTGNSPLTVTSGSFSSPSGAGAITNLPTIAQRSRTVVKSETQVLNLSDLAGQTLDFSMNLSGVSANQFALACQTASSYQITV